MTTPLRLATAAMGTRFELVILESRGGFQAPGEAALEEIDEWHRRLNRFADDSLLSHINRTARHEPVRLDRETFELLADAMAVWRASGGAFDVTMDPKVRTIGPTIGRTIGPSGPSDHPDLLVRADAWTIEFDEAGVSLDLGGIAKGHALDCAGAILRTHGVTSALLHGGTSSVLAIGTPPGSAGWQVAIGAEPGAPTVRLRDEALSVSDSQGQAGNGVDAHIRDPRDGRLVEGIGRVAVRGPSARIADAWSTALVVLGSVPDSFPAGYEALLPTAQAGPREFLSHS